MRRSKPLLLAILACAAIAAGQAAENRQDEVLNFNQEVSPSVDTIRVLRSDTKSEINNYVTEVFELKKARAIEILPLVLQTVRAEGGSAQVVERGVSPAGATTEESLAAPGSSYLQVVAPEFQIPHLRRLVAALDQENIRSESGVRFNHLRVANRDAAEVAGILESTVLSDVGRVSVDSLTNTLYVEDAISDSERALVTAAFYDVPPPQVEIRVQIVEIEGNDDSVLGLEWDAWKATLTGGYIFEYGEGYNNPETGSLMAGNAIVGIGGDALARFLNYMKENGKAEIVGQTTLTALNNESATFSNMTPLPSYRYEIENLKVGALAQVRYDQEIIDTALAAAAAGGDAVTGVANIFDHLSDANMDWLRLRERFEHSEGIALGIQPVIGTETVSLRVRALINSLTDVTKQETPLVASREISSRVNLRPGQTLKLGSFERAATVKEERGIPLLKDIPYLGYLFMKETTIRRDKRVFVFLTPEVRSSSAYGGLRLEDRTVVQDTPKPAGAEAATPVVAPAVLEQPAADAALEAMRGKLELPAVE